MDRNASTQLDCRRVYMAIADPPRDSNPSRGRRARTLHLLARLQVGPERPHDPSSILVPGLDSVIMSCPTQVSKRSDQ